MKISGPKGPGAVPPQADATKESSPAVERPSFRDALRGEGVAPATPAGLVAEVTAKLRAGEVDGAQALELLIEAIVRQQVGEAAPALRERLRAVVQETIASDPVLAEKVKHLGGDGDD